MKPNVVKDKSYRFALEIVQLSSLLQGRCLFELARQVLRSGTSIGANVEEGLAG